MWNSTFKKHATAWLPLKPCLSVTISNLTLICGGQIDSRFKHLSSMESGGFSNIYENVESARLCAVPDSEDTKGEELYDRIEEDSLSPSPTAALDGVYVNYTNNPENSHSSSVSSQHGYDGGEESDSSSEDQQHQEDIELLSPREDDQSTASMAFGNKVLSLADASQMKAQGTSKSFSTTIKFPHYSSEENNNFPKEDHEIFLIVKVSVDQHSCENPRMHAFGFLDRT